MRRRFIIVFFAFVSAIAIIAIIYLGLNFKELDTYSLALSLLGASAALLGYVMSSEAYLRGISDKDKEKVSKQENKAEKVNSNNENQEEIGGQQQEEIQERIEDPIITPQRETTSRGYSYSDIVSLRRRDVIVHFRKTEKRLNDEIDRLNRRANINLIIGSIIAFVGVLGLIAFILGESEDGQSSDITMIIVHWVTRLSLVSFVEIFALFFLKMYKTELLSIQYYQDELTSIESRKIALMFSVIHDNQEDISKTLECLVNIDRNCKLDVNQTTVDLEKLKTENSFIKTQMESVMDVFKSALSFKIKEN